MGTKSYLTSGGYKKLKQELAHLRSTKRSDIAAKIKEAREMGDVLENSVYDAAIEEQSYVEGRIKEIEDILSTSEVVKGSRSDCKIVGLGCTVVVEIGGKQDTFTIVGSVEADPLKRMISHESPVGKALMGAKVGDVIEVSTPIVKAVYKILEIK